MFFHSLLSVSNVVSAYVTECVHIFYENPRLKQPDDVKAYNFKGGKKQNFVQATTSCDRVASANIFKWKKKVAIVKSYTQISTNLPLAFFVCASYYNVLHHAYTRHCQSSFSLHSQEKDIFFLSVFLLCLFLILSFLLFSQVYQFSSALV